MAPTGAVTATTLARWDQSRLAWVRPKRGPGRFLGTIAPQAQG